MGKRGGGRRIHGKEEIANVMRDVHGQPHIREMEAVAQPDQRQRDDMMPHQLLEVLSWFFQLQAQDNGLLRPIARLQQIIPLEPAVVRAVRIPLVHALGVKIPHGRARHHHQPQRAEDGKVHRGVDLFHEAVLLGTRPDAAVDRRRPDQPLHEEFARERQHDDVKGHKGKVVQPFPVVSRRVGIEAGGERDHRVVWGERVGEEDGVMERVGGRWIDHVYGEDDERQHEGVDPGVAKGEILPSAEETPRFSTLGIRAGDFALRGALEDVSMRMRSSMRLCTPTGDRDGDVKVGVGSKVDTAAPVSPRSSSTRSLDFRRGRGMLLFSLYIVGDE